MRLKILVPVDFSENCRRALAFAIEYMQTREADLYIFYVVEDSRRSEFRGAADKLEEDLERMKDLVLNEINHMAQISGVKPQVGEVNRRIGNGKPWEEILRMAGNITADMIVMGGSQRKKKTVLKVIENAPCTVMVVKEKDLEYVLP